MSCELFNLTISTFGEDCANNQFEFLCLKVTSRSGRGIVSIQGWSNVSGSLSERIMVTRKKVELVQCLKYSSKEMDDSVRVYQDFLDMPLPQSVLAHSYKELLEKLVCALYVYEK